MEIFISTRQSHRLCIRNSKPRPIENKGSAAEVVYHRATRPSNILNIFVFLQSMIPKYKNCKHLKKPLCDSKNAQINVVRLRIYRTTLICAFLCHVMAINEIMLSLKIRFFQQSLFLFPLFLWEIWKGEGIALDLQLKV